MQACLLCRRWRDASVALESLLDGIDRDYLAAELSWRSGDLSSAVESLRRMCGGPAVPAKCTERLSCTERWHALDMESTEAFENGEVTLTPCAACTYRGGGVDTDLESGMWWAAVFCTQRQRFEGYRIEE